MKVLFQPEAFKKFRAYIHGIDYEISGFGKVEKQGENLVVTDIKIFQQVVTGGSTIMDSRSLAAFWDELIVAGEDIGKWKLWWHSHVNMMALFSQTDYDTIDEFDAEVSEENWMLSIVTNKRGDSFCRIDIYEPIRCTINNVAWSVEAGGTDIPFDVSQEIQEKVTVLNRKQEEPKKDVISWYGPKKIPIFRNGRLLSPEERIALMEEDRKNNPTLFHIPLLPTGPIIEGEVLGADGKPLPPKTTTEQ